MYTKTKFDNIIQIIICNKKLNVCSILINCKKNYKNYETKKQGGKYNEKL